MSLSAVYGGALDQNGQLRFSVIYSDGVSVKIAKDYIVAILSDTLIEQTAINEIGTLATVQVSKGAVTYQPGQVINIAPPVVPVDPLAKQRNTWNDASEAYRRAVRAFNEGHPGATQAVIDAAKVTRDAAYDPSFYSMI